MAKNALKFSHQRQGRLATVWHKTLAGENFGGIGTARKLVKKTLAVGRGKAHSLLELARSHNVLADKTLAEWQ